MQHRFLFIGHGTISKAYIKAIAKMEHAHVVGVVGRTAERAAAFAAEHDIEVHGTNIADTVSRARATAAVICTPNALHDEGVLEASRLGLHCLCEKPLHIDPQRQQAMLDSCKQHGVKLGVSYMRRFLPHIRYIKDVLDQGLLGEIQVMDVIIKHYRPKSYYDSWHGTINMDGGGPFIQQGSHIIDMALWLSGGYLDIYDAKRFKVYHKEIETEDHGYAIVRYGNNAIGMIEASTGCRGISKDMIEISGTKGSIVADYEKIHLFDVEGLTEPDFSQEDVSIDRMFTLLVQDFIAAIEEDRELFINGASAALATTFIMDIYERAGEPIATVR